MSTGRPDKKDLLFPDTLRRIRRARFRHAVDFAKATGFDPTKQRKGGLHPETIGHYERGELRPSEAMVEYMAQELGLVEGDPDYATFRANAEHDRRLWDAAASAPPEQPITPAPPTVTVIPAPPPEEAVRGADGRWHLLKPPEEFYDEAAQAAPEGDIDDPITIVIPGPPLPRRRPPGAHQHRARRIRRVAAGLVGVAILGLALVVGVHQANLLNTGLVRMPTATRGSSSTPKTPTPRPHPTGSVKLTFVGPDICDWSWDFNLQGFPPNSLLLFATTATGIDCTTHARTQGADGDLNLGPLYLGPTTSDGTCKQSYLSFAGQTWVIIGSHQFTIRDQFYAAYKLTLTASN